MLCTAVDGHDATVAAGGRPAPTASASPGSCLLHLPAHGPPSARAWSSRRARRGRQRVGQRQLLAVGYRFSMRAAAGP